MQDLIEILVICSFNNVLESFVSYFFSIPPYFCIKTYGVGMRKNEFFHFHNSQGHIYAVNSETYNKCCEIMIIATSVPCQF